MTTAALEAPTAVGNVVIDLTGSRPRVVRVERRRPVLGAMSGVLLLLLAVASVAAAAFTISYRVAFTPVLSPSMVPTFGAGDLLVTRALDTRDVRVGQVLVLPLPDAPGQRYVHRVQSVRFVDGQPVVTTKGDNNPAADPWELRVTSHQVPVVLTHVPDAGRVALSTGNPALRLVLLAGVAVLALVGIRRSFS